MSDQTKHVIFIELNEINFDYVKRYIDAGEKLSGFQRIIEGGMICTSSENEYKNLEPWIQWPSVHTGLTFDQHQIFRLGDSVNKDIEQFFEVIESAGFSVGAVSPMNAKNSLTNPDYFIPDPWTKTHADNSFSSKALSQAISQAVNDNSNSKITFKSAMQLSWSFISLVKPSKFLPLISYALKSYGKPWRKALFLDKFLYEVHKSLLLRKKTNFSTLFLNAGAHIQHHYFFNSPFTSSKLKNPKWYIDEKHDPFLEMLRVYDAMLDDLISFPEYDLIIATGLSQKPYAHLKFYYRLVDHLAFLKMLQINFEDVHPRMTRDFLITFKNADDALIAEKRLNSILVNGSDKLFNEIDNRGDSLFVTLTYPDEITQQSKINLGDEIINLNKLVTFVAIKNGEHQSTGFSFFSDGVSDFAPPNGSHVAEINSSILQIFGIRKDHRSA